MVYTKVVLIGIFCTGFFLYGINGILWIYAMDEGGRLYSGTASGILNCFAYIGAAAESFLFPIIVETAGEMISIFVVMEILCIGMVVCGIVVSEKDTRMEKEPE
jgi:sugar phosphate permease